MNVGGRVGAGIAVQRMHVRLQHPRAFVAGGKGAQRRIRALELGKLRRSQCVDGLAQHNGRVSLPGMKWVPPVGGAGQPLGGSCANAFKVEKTVLEPANTEPPARAAAPLRKRRRLGPPLSCFIRCLRSEVDYRRQGDSSQTHYPQLISLNGSSRSVCAGQIVAEINEKNTVRGPILTTSSWSRKLNLQFVAKKRGGSACDRLILSIQQVP